MGAEEQTAATYGRKLSTGESEEAQSIRENVLLLWPASERRLKRGRDSCACRMADPTEALGRLFVGTAFWGGNSGKDNTVAH